MTSFYMTSLLCSSVRPILQIVQKLASFSTSALVIEKIGKVKNLSVWTVNKENLSK
jgi:hypothetical protein